MKEPLEMAIERGLTARAALVSTFPDLEDDGNEMRAACCGRIVYGSGIIGEAVSARCEKCGREVLDFLAVGMSPFLFVGRGGGAVLIPSDETLARVGERHWIGTAGMNAIREEMER